MTGVAVGIVEQRSASSSIKNANTRKKLRVVSHEPTHRFFALPVIVLDILGNRSTPTEADAPQADSGAHESGV
jgi:hypothetical protein